MRRGLGDPCKRNPRPAKTRRLGVAQERGLQYECGFLCRHCLEWNVECGDQKRLPERADFGRTLTVAREPSRERFVLELPVCGTQSQKRARKTEPAADAERPVMQQRPREMKRRGQRRGAQTAAHVRPDDQNVEAILHVQVLRHPQALDEAQKLRAARQEDVLSVVDFVAGDGKRRCAPSEQTRALEELDRMAFLFQRQRRRETRKSAADDRYTGRSQDPTITSSFSDGESEVLPRNGKSGSRSIFSRIRS